MKSLKLKLCTSALFAALFVLSSCNQNPPLTPTNSLASAITAVSNQVDNISIAYSSLSGVTDNISYTYACTGDTSELSIGGYLTGGSLDVTITDNQGNSIYSQTLQNTLGFNGTLTAQSGNWDVEIQLNNVSGEIGINCEKQ